MSEEVAAPVAPFILARFHGNLVKLAAQPAELGEGFSLVIGEDGFVTEHSVHSLTLQQLGELYGEIAGTQPKKFKDKAIAVESLAYQVGKLKFTDTSAPKVEAKPASKASNGAPTASKGGKEQTPKKVQTFVLLTPETAAEALKSLPPQARAIVSALTDVVASKGAPEVSAEELEARLRAPDSPLNTKQLPMRIVAYYRKKLEDSGLLQVKE